MSVGRGAYFPCPYDSITCCDGLKGQGREKTASLNYLFYEHVPLSIRRAKAAEASSYFSALLPENS
jgi:hypothetical protein